MPLRLGVVPFLAAGLAFGFAPLPVAAFLLAGAALLLAATRRTAWAQQTNQRGRDADENYDHVQNPASPAATAVLTLILLTPMLQAEGLWWCLCTDATNSKVHAAPLLHRRIKEHQ